MGFIETDFNPMLAVIAERLDTRQTVAQWQLKNSQNFKAACTSATRWFQWFCNIRPIALPTSPFPSGCKSMSGKSNGAKADPFHYWENQEPNAIGATQPEFLKVLSGPTYIHLHDKDRSRCRAATTLLHGNEPSSLHAVWETLRRGTQPVVDLHYLIPSVDATKQARGFIYRMLPHHKDLNRCFKLPYGDTEQDLLAQAIMQKLEKYKPECVLDIHSASGSSPSFGVTTFMDDKHDALVSLSTHRMIVTDISLGALMEISDAMMPTATIECGGSQDAESNLMAVDSLIKYLTYEDVLSNKHTDMSLEFFHNPMRLELLESSDIAYGDHSQMESGVTRLPDIENHNFGNVDSGHRLGFIAGILSEHLKVSDPNGNEAIEDYFELKEGVLFPKRRLKFFMVTTNPEIARKDCLLYLVLAD